MNISSNIIQNTIKIETLVGERRNELNPLKPKKSNKAKFCVFDLEAKNWTEQMLIGFYDGKKFHYFKGKDCVENFLKFFLTHKYRRYTCYAHNGGRYDFNFLLEYLIPKQMEHKLSVDMIKSGSRILRMKIKKGNLKDNWYFIDSYALLPLSLAKLTEGFDTEHKKLEIDYEKMEEDEENTLIYLRNDCMGLYEVIEKFKEQFDQLGVGLKMTIAQQSLSAFRRTMKKPIPCIKEHEDFIRQGYFGGRTEVFKRFGENLYGMDINSLYPYCQWKYPMPIGKPDVVFSWKNIEKDALGFAEAIVHAPKDLYIPLLPIKYNQKLYFPIGKFRGIWDIDELRKAEELGYKIKIIKALIFPKEFIFKDFVEHYYSIKKKVDPRNPMYIISKLIMNSSYGKFGQRRETETIIINPKNPAGLKPLYFEYGIFTKDTINKSSHIIPSISAHVTACARLELYKWIEKVGEEHVYYCDTDSIFSDKPLPTSHELGDMKLEYEIEKGIFISPKFYYLKLKNGTEKIKMKGFPNPQFTEEDFMMALNDDFSRFHYNKQVFGTFSEAMRRFRTPKIMIEKVKSIKTKYDKRKIVEKIYTIPYKFQELIKHSPSPSPPSPTATNRINSACE